MTFDEAVALQPAWIGIWLNILLLGAFILPVALLFWKQSRMAGIFTLIASAVSAAGVMYIYDQMGYVKLMGLPHVIFWTPIAFYLFKQIKRDEMPKYPRWIMMAVLATLLVSLAFDYTDVARWLLGERQSFAV